MFSDTTRFGRYLEIELLATEAQAELGIVPAEDASDVPARRPGRPTTRSSQAVSDREAVTDHDVAAFVDVVQAAIGQPAGAWIHYGLTSSDVVDTAWCWALRDAADLLLEASTALLTDGRRACHDPPRHRDDRANPRHPRRADDVRRQGRAVGVADRSRP